MEFTMCSSVREVCAISFSTSDFGMTPIARPPAEIRERAHQAYAAAAEDQSDAGGRELVAEMLGCADVGGIIAAARTTEDTEPRNAVIRCGVR
jgi:hypothetical protein